MPDTKINSKTVKVKPQPKAKTEKPLEVSVYDLKGKTVGLAALPKAIFGVKVNIPLIKQYVRVYLQNQRQGNASTKTRGEVTGSTRKIYRQKGTGNARHGSIKAPIFVGGGITFGPKPRDYSLKMNKKQKTLALFSSLTIKANDKEIFALQDEVGKMKPKTKEVALFLKTIKKEKGKFLLVMPKMEKNGYVLSARNLPNVEMTQAASLNPYILMRSNAVIFLEEALTVLEKHFLKQNAN